MKKTAAVLLAVILVLSLCACGGGGNENTSVSNKRTAIATNDFVAKAKELGYENALNELQGFYTTTVDGETYYRLQQTYQGIPVYGRYVVVVADDSAPEYGA